MNIPPIPATVDVAPQTQETSPDNGENVTTQDTQPTESNENQESDPTLPTADSPAPDIDRLIAEAEERGYKRGRNESIQELMEQPAPAVSETEQSEILILSNIRPSIWS